MKDTEQTRRSISQLYEAWDGMIALRHDTLQDYLRQLIRADADRIAREKGGLQSVMPTMSGMDLAYADLADAKVYGAWLYSAKNRPRSITRRCK